MSQPLVRVSRLPRRMTDFVRGRPRDARRADSDSLTAGVPRAAPDGAAADGRRLAERLAPEPLAREIAATAARPRPVCGHWDAADFDAFVERLARTRLQWVERGDVM